MGQGGELLGTQRKEQIPSGPPPLSSACPYRASRGGAAGRSGLHEQLFLYAAGGGAAPGLYHRPGRPPDRGGGQDGGGTGRAFA